MNRFALPLVLPCLFPASALADDFTGFSVDFVDVGNPGNAADNTGYGAVGYNYRMSTHEVSRAMIDSYNANSGGPAITMYDYAAGEITGGNLAGRPATGVTWNEAARFVNWLNTSNGHSPAYNTTGDANDNITLWGVGDAGYDPANPFRNSNAYYFLPSEDEWYKAAYYDPNHGGAGVGGYWDYATGSDLKPEAISGGTRGDGAVYGQSLATGPALVTDAGGLSPYGTMAQSGNVWEWSESGYKASSDPAGGSRVIRGGTWNSTSRNSDFNDLQSSERSGASPTDGSSNIGFRVASVPEPSAALMTLLGALGLLMKRNRP